MCGQVGTFYPAGGGVIGAPRPGGEVRPRAGGGILSRCSGSQCFLKSERGTGHLKPVPRVADEYSFE